MALSQRLKHVLIGVLIGVVMAGGGLAVASVARSSRRPYHGLIRGCVNKRTRVVTLLNRCGRSARPIGWNGTGERGRRGARGAPGTANAWGVIYPTVNNDAGQIAPGSKNVLSFTYNSPGNYTVYVSGCGVAGTEGEASIQADAGQALDAGYPTTSDPVQAIVTSWQEVNSDPGGVQYPRGSVAFDVTLWDLKTQALVDDDFSFTVNC